MRKIYTILFFCAIAQISFAQDFVLKEGAEVPVWIPSFNEPIAATARQMLADDLQKVLEAQLVKVKRVSKAKIVVTLDERLPRDGFRMEVKKGRLELKASDAHGVAYGLLEISRLLGVSPWEWWADCEPKPQKQIVLKEGFITEQSPAVAYRGLFINDEDWGILPWSGGVIGPETNERIFQLMLRLRANYYWPAMHEVSKPFFSIEGNREMAHKYGIYIGGSHCEPMGTSPANEWEMRGVGDYNYVTNAENVRRFWTERLEEVKGQDMVYTIGMRGVHDGSMQGVKTKEDKLHYLQQVIDDQRHMLAEYIDTDFTQIPQVFVPYKEVLDIYHDGLRVPDDVTLMWTDDNYGYIRHFPDSVERSRQGGNGIYYHISYWGRPHDYLWLGTFSPFLLRQQLTEAYRRGIRRMWILNVGDIKPAEYQIEDFLNIAWMGMDDGSQQLESDDKIIIKKEEEALRSFLEREFGTSLADTLSAVMIDHYRLAFNRKPEHMGGTRVEENDRDYWNTFRPIDGWSISDVRQRVNDYQRLSDAVENLERSVPSHHLDAYFQLVKYPVQAAAQMNFKFLSGSRSAQASDSIVALTRIYNDNPRWKGIMDKAPRELPVFGKVTKIPVYHEAQPDTLLFDADMWTSVPSGTEKSFIFESSDSLAFLEVRLLPNHPVQGERLTFSLSADNHMPQVFDYQTYDRSEEWKQNVLRNYALRFATIPLTKGERSHTLTFKALTEGVYLRQIRLMK